MEDVRSWWIVYNDYLSQISPQSTQVLKDKAECYLCYGG